MAKLKNRFSAFRRDERGGLVVFMAVVAIPLIVAMGLAVDAGRGYLVKSRLGEALDAAALAGAISVNNSNFEEEINMVFNANFPPGYLGANVTLNTPVVIEDPDGDRVSLSATAEVQTTFMRVAGLNTLNVGTAAEVTRRTVSLDVALSVDMSGSMDGSRIESAREASHALVDILYGDNATNDLLKVGLVPWNSKVNVTDGTAINTALTETVAVDPFVHPITGANQSQVFVPTNTQVPFFTAPAADWTGCAYGRYIHDTSPVNLDNDADGLLGPVETVDGTDWPAWEWIPTNEGELPDCGGSVCGCLDVGITPMTDTKATIEAAIDALTSPVGPTNIAQGLSWAYRVVSPGVPFAEADPSPEGNHVRAIVLLTDGEQYGWHGDGFKKVFGTGTGAGAAGMDQRLRDLADYIKSQGIKIYTIQYVHSSGDLATLMKYVASEPGSPYYHFAPTTGDLSAVFQQVANHLTDLRLSK